MADSGVPISPVTGSKPELTLSAASVNNEPVELDSTPVSPEKVRRGSKGTALDELSPQERERRAQLHDERQGDAAVMVDIPQTPQAEELEQAGATVQDESTTAPIQHR